MVECRHCHKSTPTTPSSLCPNCNTAHLVLEELRLRGPSIPPGATTAINDLLGVALALANGSVVRLGL